MEWTFIANILVMSALLFFLYKLQKHNLKFNYLVFIGLGIGVLYGVALHFFYGENLSTLKSLNNYFNLIGQGYVKLLKMIIIPLVMVSILSAILKLKGSKALGRITVVNVSVLLILVSIAAMIGFFVSFVFDLSAEGLTAGAKEIAANKAIGEHMGEVQALSIPSMLLSLIPSNIFSDMAGLKPTSVISVVVFSIFLGIAGLIVHKNDEQTGLKFDRGVKVLHSLVLTMVRMVLKLTPYGVLALMAHVTSSSNYSDIFKLIDFVVASYVALAMMILAHLVVVFLFGGNPLQFIKKIFPVLSFAFVSRSSAATIPLSVNMQEKGLGIPEGIANFAASIGATVGQNGCAGIYPAMLAVMIAPTVGVDPWSLSFLLTVLLTIIVGSFGVAGMGGGATFASLIVLSSINFPLALVGLLISIEPLIDMGRTAVNVSGSMTSGFVTSRILNQHNMEVYNDSSDIAEADLSLNERL